MPAPSELSGVPWRSGRIGIQFNSGSTGTLDHVVARFGGFSGCCGGSQANLHNNGGTLSLSNAVVASSSNYGIRVAGGTTTVAHAEIYGQTNGVYSDTGSGPITVATSTLRNNTSYGMQVSHAGALTVTDSSFLDNSNGGALLSFGNGLTFTHSGNTSTSGAKRGFIVSGPIATSQTWTADGMPYIVQNVTVPTGKTLTVDAGAVLKFETTNSLLTVNGILDAQGSSSSPAYFTSIHHDLLNDTDNATTPPAKGNWRDIVVNSGATASFVYTGVYYGGRSGSGLSGANIYNNGGTLTIASSTIAASSVYGIRQASGSATTTTSIIYGNTNGLYIEGGTAEASLSDFANNTSYGLYNSTTPTTTAQNNFWGGWIANDLGGNPGPYHATANATGTGDIISDYVDFGPYLEAYLYDPADGGPEGNSPPAVDLDVYEIRWAGSTQYSSEWDAATSTWVASTAGIVSIVENQILPTLVIDDAPDETHAGLDWVGYWTPGSPALIEFNADVMGSLTPNQRKHVALHELGHALGLAHSYGSDEIMYGSAVGNVQLGSQDLHDFEYTWNPRYRWGSYLTN